jgi:hypothetical protein
MDRIKVKLIVEVELDIIPGAFHTPESAQACVQAILTSRISHYNPRVQIQKD